MDKTHCGTPLRRMSREQWDIAAGVGIASRPTSGAVELERVFSPRTERTTWRDLLERACKDSLRDLAQNALNSDTAGRKSVEEIVREAAVRALEEDNLQRQQDDAAHEDALNSSGGFQRQQSKTTPPLEPLLKDLKAIPWTLWRERCDGSAGGDIQLSGRRGSVVGDIRPENFSGRRGSVGVLPFSPATFLSSPTDDALPSIASMASLTSEEVADLSDPTSPANPNATVVKTGLAIPSATAQRLMMLWNSQPRTVLLVAKRGDRLINDYLQDMGAWLASQRMVVVLEPQCLADQPHLNKALRHPRTFSKADRLESAIDLVITIGGDGTLTWAVSLFTGPMPPVVSFAAGSLGFLTPFVLDSWVRTLTQLLELNRTRLPIELVCRMRLRVTVRRRRRSSSGHGEADLNGDPGSESGAAERVLCVQCLNEVLVHRGQSSALAKLEVGVDGEKVTLVQGDGLILATPTGSTAYSLAAGGSMVHPGVPAVLLTPVSPHSLSFRPVLLPNSATIIVGVPFTARNGAALSVDGKDLCHLGLGDSVEVAVSPNPVPTICCTTGTKDWFGSVHNALRWNSDSADHT